MSVSLYFDRPEFIAQLRELLARVPVPSPKVTVAFLAGAGSVSAIALGLSSPTVPAVAPTPQVATVQPVPTQSEPVRSCKEQTWPYVDRVCTQQDANHQPRAVRVISTDRGAPAMLNAAPVVAAASAQAPVPSTTGGNMLLSASVAGDTLARAEPQEAVPMPTPRPAQMSAAERSAAAPRVRKVVTLPSPPIRAEDDDGVQVRAYALPNGRRVTVYTYENPADRAVAPRPDVYERRPFRSPFGGLFD